MMEKAQKITPEPAPSNPIDFPSALSVQHENVTEPDLRDHNYVVPRQPEPGESWLDQMEADRAYTRGWWAYFAGKPDASHPHEAYHIAVRDALEAVRRGRYRRPFG